MNESKIERPFYFMVPFWGQRYREYFVDLCLPSLLAPNNLALLQVEDGHRFLIATTREDWQAIEHLPIMERLRRHATPTWIEINDPQNQTSTDGEVYAQYVSSIQQQNFCQKKLIEVAYRDRTYGCLLCPDFILSDGVVASLLKYAQAGYHLVLCPALRQTEEAVLDDLSNRGYLASGKQLSITERALTIPPRVMADLFVRHLHPDIEEFEYGNPIPDHPFVVPFRFWRLPGSRGMVLHTFFALPFLMDFTVVPTDHIECLDQDIFENIYYSKNFARSNRVRVIQDSDEFCVVSLTPGVNRAMLSASLLSPKAGTHYLGWKRSYDQLHNMRKSMWYYVARNHDVVRGDLFRLSIRLHTTDLDKVWMAEERRIDRLIRCAVGDYYQAGEYRFPSGFSLDPRVLLMDVPAKIHAAMATLKGHLILVAGIAGRRLGLALCGDAVALRWWGWRLRKLRAGMMGRPFQEPRPPIP